MSKEEEIRLLESQLWRLSEKYEAIFKEISVLKEKRSKLIREAAVRKIVEEK